MLFVNNSVKLEPDEFCSDSDIALWRSDNDGVELISESAGEREFEISDKVVADWLSLFVTSPGLAGSCCFRTFRRYFARAFWNQTWNGRMKFLSQSAIKNAKVNLLQF